MGNPQQEANETRVSLDHCLNDGASQVQGEVPTRTQELVLGHRVRADLGLPEQEVPSGTAKLRSCRQAMENHDRKRERGTTRGLLSQREGEKKGPRSCGGLWKKEEDRTAEKERRTKQC